MNPLHTFPAARSIRLRACNAAEHPLVGVQKLDLPCLMLTAEYDPALRPEFAEGMRPLCPDLELHLVKNVGHWVQQEAPGAVNEHIISWLTKVTG